MAPSKKDEPILHSVLEDDLYKFTLGQFIWRFHRDVPVTLAFNNRTRRVRLADYIPIERLREELEHRRRLRLTDAEADWLLSGANLKPGIFCREYVDFFRTLELPEPIIEVIDGQFHITASGPWANTTNWEIPILKTVNALYYEARMKQDGRSWEEISDEGRRRLRPKLALLNEHQVPYLEFGNRRAFHPRWHREADELMLTEARQLVLGISNMLLAKEFGTKPGGTIPHEPAMVYGRLFGDDPDAIRNSFFRLHEDWWEMYGHDQAVVLTDTCGSAFCLRQLEKSPSLTQRYRALRHDSGDPYNWGHRVCAFYKGMQIDPLTKTGIFSDGLTPELMVSLKHTFDGLLGTAMGWGTHATNDVGYDPASLVAKIIRANGCDTVKLSDNPAKSQGPAELVKYYKTVHDYSESEFIECIV